jgi:hypothetical protein
MKLISKALAYAAILGLPIEKQDEMAVVFVKGNARLKDNKDEQKEGAKVMGKFLCALEIRLENAKQASAIAQNKTLAEFFKDQYGAAIQTHPLSLKNAFGNFVLNKFISETDYDCNSGNCLEIAARIVTAVKGDLTHNAVVKAAAELIERSNKAAQNLRDILATVKPAAKLTPDEAMEMFNQILADGQVAVVLAELPDVLAREDAPAEIVKSAVLAMDTAMSRIYAGPLEPRVKVWLEEKDAATAEPQLVTQEAA